MRIDMTQEEFESRLKSRISGRLSSEGYLPPDLVIDSLVSDVISGFGLRFQPDPKIYAGDVFIHKRTGNEFYIDGHTHHIDGDVHHWRVVPLVRRDPVNWGSSTVASRSRLVNSSNREKG